MSLFGDDGFEVTKVILAEPALHAHKLADGQGQLGHREGFGEEPAGGGASEEGVFVVQPLDCAISRISDAAIRYEDDSTGMRFRPRPFRSGSGATCRPTGPTSTCGSRRGAVRLVSGGIPLLSGAEAELVAVIEADLKNNRFTFSRNTLRLNAISSLGLDGWAEMKDDAVAMDLTAGCDKVQFKDVLSLVPAFYTREFKNLSAGGELSMALWAQWRDARVGASGLRTENRGPRRQFPVFVLPEGGDRHQHRRTGGRTPAA